MLKWSPLRSIPRALRGRDATEEFRWIMSLELDGGKHVLAITGEITKMGVVWAPLGSSSLAVEGVRGRGRGSMRW